MNAALKPEATSSSTVATVQAGAYNDSRIAVDGNQIRVCQNPAMFVVLGVLALICSAVIIGITLSGRGEMRISGILISQALARPIGFGLGGVFGLAMLASFVQAMKPAALFLDLAQRRYERTTGIVGTLLGKKSTSGSFEEFQKLTLARESFRAQDGTTKESWRLTLYFNNSTSFNLGSFAKAEPAQALAAGFSSQLGMPLEQT